MQLGTLEVRRLRGALLAWFGEHKRDLPWRRTADPYAIWVSEVMLQQTRVAAVLDHYARWMARFPTVCALAAAEEPEVLALWSGLGYYRRARYLHAGARAVVRDHAGALPQTAASLRVLPGIGEYTSAAIASIAFGEAVAVVDGNVERVMTRLAGLAGMAEEAEEAEEAPRAARVTDQAWLSREIRAATGALLDPACPGDWNQAVMELGATVCLPRSPLCLHCPVQAWCATRGEHPTAPRKAMAARTIAYSLAQRRQGGALEVLLAQRPAGTSLMAGMWELPEVAESSTDAPALLTVRHAITVTNYTVRIVEAAPAAQDSKPAGSLRWVPVGELPGTALTGLARKVLRRLALCPSRCAARAAGDPSRVPPGNAEGVRTPSPRLPAPAERVDRFTARTTGARCARQGLAAAAGSGTRPPAP